MIEEIKTKTEEEKKHILEVASAEDANQLIASGEYRLERYSDSKACYILVRRAR